MITKTVCILNVDIKVQNMNEKNSYISQDNEFFKKLRDKHRKITMVR